MCTEVSAKFRLPGVRALLAAAGFDTIRSWTDQQKRMALTLATAV
jgi:L-histidine N-alpha-methyltransferase